MPQHTIASRLCICQDNLFSFNILRKIFDKTNNIEITSPCDLINARVSSNGIVYVNESGR